MGMKNNYGNMTDWLDLWIFQSDIWCTKTKGGRRYGD